MPMVPENRLKGNYGAAAVAERLSKDCLVRPVQGDTDVGIDLYCETVIDNQPFLHFWLQVKAGNQCSPDPAGQHASCRFDTDHLEYWSRQPVPVFAALVPGEWPVTQHPDIYVVDITTRLLQSKGWEKSKSVAWKSDYRWPHGSPEEVRAFLCEAVPDTTARLEISKGVVSASPTLKPNYVRKTPFAPVSRYKDQISAQIRRTAAHSVLFLFSNRIRSPEDTEFRKRMASVVELFGDDLHWENFMSRGLSHHVDDDFDEAVSMYQKARATIQSDQRVCGQRDWQETIQYISGLEALARERKPPR